MKETKTINMFGILYRVDADAYDLLSRYLGEMRSYFAGRKGCGEIADDIECRIAELMEEYKLAGVQSITIDNVREIISRIGRPEDFGGGDEDDSGKPESAPGCCMPAGTDKKLFRDTDHKMLGGVFAGLGCYWNVNPLWFRLLFVLLAPLSVGVVSLLYIVAWISIPPAVTPADRLQMRGESVNVGNLTEQIMKDGHAGSDSRRSVADTGISAILQTLCFIFKGLLVIAGGAFILWCVAILMITLVYGLIFFLSPVGAAELEWGTNDLTNVQIVMASCPTTLLVLTFLGIIATFSLTVFMCLHFILKMTGKVKPLSVPVKVACVVTWFIALVVMMSAGFRTIYECEMTMHRLNEARNERTRVESDIWQETFLADRGWRLVKNEGSEHLVARGKHYSGDRAVNYLDAFNPYGKMKYEAVKEEKVVPGKYRLTAYARTDGDGVEVFTATSAGRNAVAVPSDGERGGSVWREARKANKSRNGGRSRLREARVNHGRGYGWNRITVDSITVGRDSMITYGVTNDSPSGYWNGKWLSACEFRLEKVG